MHKLDLCLYSRHKEIVGMESEPMLTPREISRPGKWSSEDRTQHTASSRTASPTHYQPAIPPPSSRTASPTHYQRATPAPIKQDSQSNTLPTNYSPIKQDSQPNTLPTSYSGPHQAGQPVQHTTNQLFPHQAGQPAQHTTNELFRPPSSRTASPTHYHPAIPAP